MHSPDIPPIQLPATGQGWWRDLTRYHWFVFVVAALGWLFDTMDQQLFTLARSPAMMELRKRAPNEDLAFTKARAAEAGGYATMVFMLGWATGGVAFGIMGDRVGRARTMALTILVYSAFTGLSALSVGVWDFAAYRFLTGLGVGGEFAVGVSLVAEVMPDRARPHALGWLQASSAIGNVSAAGISLLLGRLEFMGVVATGWAWRSMFLIGVLPALLVLFIMRRLQEPERWRKAAETRKDQGPLHSLFELFSVPRWRRNAIIGMLLAFSGVVGLWGIGFFSYDLLRLVFRTPIEAEARAAGEDEFDRQFVRLAVRTAVWPDDLRRLVQPNDLLDPITRPLFEKGLALQKAGTSVSPAALFDALEKDGQTAAQRTERAQLLEGSTGDVTDLSDAARHIADRARGIDGRLTGWVGIAGLLQNLGGFLGVYAFSRMAAHTGRKPAFALGFLLALVSTAFTYWFLKGFADIWMIPVMGFCQLSVFGGYAIYFPELFPTRLRSTGTSFCYNVGRYVAAVGPLFLGLLTSRVFVGFEHEPMRYAGVAMCAFFLVGLLVLPFAPETKGQPLPE